MEELECRNVLTFLSAVSKSDRSDLCAAYSFCLDLDPKVTKGWALHSAPPFSAILHFLVLYILLFLNLQIDPYCCPLVAGQYLVVLPSRGLQQRIVGINVPSDLTLLIQLDIRSPILIIYYPWPDSFHITRLGALVRDCRAQ